METASDSPQDSTSGGSEVQSPAAGSEESPVFDNSNNPLSLQVKFVMNRQFFYRTNVTLNLAFLVSTW